MLFTHPAESVGRGGRINPAALRAALIAAGLLVPRGEHPRRHPRARDVAPRLEIDALGRRVAAARVAGDLDYYDCGDTFESWVGTNFSRRLRMRGEP